MEGLDHLDEGTTRAIGLDRTTLRREFSVRQLIWLNANIVGLGIFLKANC